MRVCLSRIHRPPRRHPPPHRSRGLLLIPRICWGRGRLRLSANARAPGHTEPGRARALSGELSAESRLRESGDALSSAAASFTLSLLSSAPIFATAPRIDSPLKPHPSKHQSASFAVHITRCEGAEATRRGLTAPHSASSCGTVGTLQGVHRAKGGKGGDGSGRRGGRG